MKLTGARELRARFKALRLVFKPIGRQWADGTVRRAKGRVRVRSGKTKNSIRRQNATQRKAAVSAGYGARFLDKGTVPHELRPKKVRAMKFNVAGRPMFAKRVHHPGAKAQPFLRVSAREELASSDKVDTVIRAWNSVAPGISAPGLGVGKGGGLGI